MERPFNAGDSIARESLIYEDQELISIPNLNVEDEIKLVLESKKSLGENAASQKLKELGLERYNGFDPNICLFEILLNKNDTFIVHFVV